MIILLLLLMMVMALVMVLDRNLRRDIGPSELGHGDYLGVSTYIV